MNLAEWTPLIRHVLQLLSGGLVAGGFIGEEMAVALTGAGVSIFTLLWYLVARLDR